jgi:hypothetical protein
MRARVLICLNSDVCVNEDLFFPFVGDFDF